MYSALRTCFDGRMSEREAFRAVYRRSAGAIGYVCVESAERGEGCGTAFHIGDGYWITARHVIEDHKILGLGTPMGNVHISEAAQQEFGELIQPQYTSTVFAGAKHPDAKVDIALLLTPGFVPKQTIVLGGDAVPVAEEILLEPVLLMGFPRIPGAQDQTPALVATTGEVTAVAMLDGGAHIFVSPIARGGFSGGPVLRSNGDCLGVAVRESFEAERSTPKAESENKREAESGETVAEKRSPAGLGFFGVLGVQEVRTLLETSLVVPADQRNVRTVEELIADLHRKSEERRRAIRSGEIRPRFFISAWDGDRTTCSYGAEETEEDAQYEAETIAKKDAARQGGPRWSVIRVFREADLASKPPVYSTSVGKYLTTSAK